MLMLILHNNYMPFAIDDMIFISKMIAILVNKFNSNYSHAVIYRTAIK